jgi:hypothetical protein
MVWGVMRTEVENAAANGLGGTGAIGTCATLPNYFSTNSILLVGKSERGKRCDLDLMFRGCTKV